MNILAGRKAKFPTMRRGILLVLAFAALRFGSEDYDLHARLERPSRLLRASALNAPGLLNATTAAVITIHIADRSRRGNRDENPAHSIFFTDVLRRYGSGRVGHRVVEHDYGDRGCRTEPLATDDGPCLAVTKRRKKENYEALKCNFPKCKTAVTNDELCRGYGKFEMREYYTARMPRAGYLPLGPRRDAWQSLQTIQATPDFAPKAASERRYAFNAVFSQSTNKGRGKLAEIITNHADDPLPTFTSMAKTWTKNVNDRHSKQLDTYHYMKAALDSVFTLAPAGHNAECFRMYEAAEAGSVPVFLRADLYAGWSCRRGLQDWYDAPAVVLDSWEDLYPTIKALMEDPVALDARQEQLRQWYEGYMRGVVAKFEDFLVGEADPLADALLEQPLEVAVTKSKRKKNERKLKTTLAKKRRKRKKMKKAAMIS